MIAAYIISISRLPCNEYFAHSPMVDVFPLQSTHALMHRTTRMPESSHDNQCLRARIRSLIRGGMEKEIEQVIEEVRALCLTVPADQLHAMLAESLPLAPIEDPAASIEVASVRHLLGYRRRATDSEGPETSEMLAPTPQQMQARLRKITWPQAAVLLGTFMSAWMRVSPLRSDLRNATSWSVKFKRRLLQHLAAPVNVAR